MSFELLNLTNWLENFDIELISIHIEEYTMYGPWNRASFTEHTAQCFG